MSDPSDFIVKVRNDCDIVISKPEAGFEVTYRREMYSPILIASDVLCNDFDESKVTLLAQAWKLALSKAKSLGWLDEPRLRRRNCRLSRAERS
jgi:hypothetical protein